MTDDTPTVTWSAGVPWTAGTSDMKITAVTYGGRLFKPDPDTGELVEVDIETLPLGDCDWDDLDEEEFPEGGSWKMSNELRQKMPNNPGGAYRVKLSRGEE